jgi:hypothetical protein
MKRTIKFKTSFDVAGYIKSNIKHLDAIYNGGELRYNIEVDKEEFCDICGISDLHSIDIGDYCYGWCELFHFRIVVGVPTTHYRLKRELYTQSIETTKEQT